MSLSSGPGTVRLEEISRARRPSRARLAIPGAYRVSCLPLPRNRLHRRIHPASPERPPLRDWTMQQINPGSLASPSIAGGVILVSMNIEPSHEAEFNDWYNTEHIPHFNRLDGVIAARRFCAIAGNPRYVALYHVGNTDIYATPGWMAANQTPWMLRMRRYQRDRIYFMFRERIA